jgi:hypothetical protein
MMLMICDMTAESQNSGTRRRKRGGKHVSTATNQHGTREELLEDVFPVRALPRLYSEAQQQQSNRGRGMKAPRANRE